MLFRGETTSVESRLGKAAGKDEVTEEMVKGGGDMVVDWIWKLSNNGL